MTSKTTIYGTTEAAAKAIGVESDEIFVLDEGEEIKINDERTPEERLLDDMATCCIRENARREKILSLGMVVDSADMEEFNTQVSAMVVDLLNAKSASAFSMIAKNYGDLAKMEPVVSFIKRKLT